MLRIKLTIFFVLSVILILSDLIITPYEITYATRPIMAFLGIIFVSYLDLKMADAKDPWKIRRVFYFSVVAIFITGIILSVFLRQHITTFPFVVGCMIQTVIYLKVLKRSGRSAGAGGLERFESPIPAIGYFIMSGILFIRDLFLNHVTLLESVGLKEGDQVLDFGCGPGAFSFAAASIVGETGMVYALDNHHLSVESINRKIDARKIKNMKTIYSNQSETGFDDGSVDVVLLIGVLHLIRNRERLMTELTRVLKADGRLMVVPMHMTKKELYEILSPGFTFKERVNVMEIFCLEKRCPA